MEVTKLVSEPWLLSSSFDWPDWISNIKAIATTSEVWDFIDPNKENPRKLEEPRIPTFSQVKSDISNDVTIHLDDLTDSEKNNFRYLKREYGRDYEDFKQQSSAINNIRELIANSVALPNASMIVGKPTVHAMLRELQLHIAPSDRAFELEVINRYQKLKKGPTRRGLHKWLLDWTFIHDHAVKAQIPDIQNQRDIMDFIQAVKDLAPEWTGYWEAHLTLQANAITMESMLKIFRQYIQEMDFVRGHQPSRFATAALDDIDQSGEPTPRPKKQLSKVKRTCFCGKLHLWEDCFYFNVHIRPKNWQPAPKVLEKIDTVKEQKPFMAQAIKKAQILIERRNKANMRKAIHRRLPSQQHQRKRRR